MGRPRKEDSKVNPNIIIQNLREFNRDLIQDNLDLAKRVHELSEEVDTLERKFKVRNIQEICVLIIVAIGIFLICLGL